jgi:hypothetical protein
VARLIPAPKRDWKEKAAHELYDHDVIEGHGMVDWVAGHFIGGGRYALVHVHSGTPERGSYTILFPRDQKVRFYRS